MPYLTPPTTPESTDCRALLIPASSDWLAIFGGALTELIYKYNWEQSDGGITVDDALQVVMTVINGFYDGCVNSGCTLPDGEGIFRLDANGNVEQLVNGEWVRPIGDATIPPVPPREEATADERKCFAAANAANVYEQLYEEITEMVGEDRTLEEIVIGILAWIAVRFFWLAPIAAGLLLLALAAIELVVALVEIFGADLWDTDFTETFKCILYECAISEGDVVTFDYNCVQDKLATTLDVPDLNAEQLRLLVQLGYLLNVVGGADALNHAGATTEIETADCEDCGETWCYTWDFTLADGSAQGWYQPDPTLGHWQSGVGWVADVLSPTSNVIYIENDTALPQLAQVRMLYLKTAGSGSNNRNHIELYNSGGLLALDSYDEVGAEPIEKVFSGDWTSVTAVIPNINAGDESGASVVIISVTLRGDGENPFGEDNC